MIVFGEEDMNDRMSDYVDHTRAYLQQLVSQIIKVYLQSGGVESSSPDSAWQQKEVEKEFLQEGLSQEKILLMSGELEKIIAEINAKEERWFVLSSKLEE